VPYAFIVCISLFEFSCYPKSIIHYDSKDVILIILKVAVSGREIIILVPSAEYGSVSRVDGFISYHLFSLRGPLQDYKIRMDMEIVSTVHESNNNVCVRSQELKSL
jgi:hypothetical protein